MEHDGTLREGTAKANWGCPTYNGFKANKILKEFMYKMKERKFDFDHI